MIGFLIILLSSIIFFVGLFTMRKIFFSLAKRALHLLDCLLNDQLEDAEKGNLLFGKTLKLLLSNMLFVLALLFVIFLSFLPYYLYCYAQSISLKINWFLDGSLNCRLDVSTLAFLFATFLGGIIPIVFHKLVNRKEVRDYSELSKLLHRLILDNQYVSKQLFKIERRWFVSKLIDQFNEDYVIVSGLARSGTTALTTILSESQQFHHLKYSNMPFLLSPNLWQKFTGKQKGKEKERSHGDKVKMHYQSVEALEEYFFKAFLNDSFIQRESLVKHEISEDNYKNYIHYQSLTKNAKANDTLYLAKNNNLLLRYKSLRNMNSIFKVVFMFRKPVDQANSLLKQHLRFSKIQKDDPFVLEYMNWLGHHEFGLNHKPFNFNNNNSKIDFDINTIDYWLQIWINYYDYLLEFVNDKNVAFINYESFLNNPETTLQSIEQKLNINFNLSSIEKFDNTNKYSGSVNSTLEQEANSIYSKLLTI